MNNTNCGLVCFHLAIELSMELSNLANSTGSGAIHKPQISNMEP